MGIAEVDDEELDELRTRRGKFLRVEKDGNNYRETSASGETVDYAQVTPPFEIGVESLALHATSDVASEAVRYRLTGATREQFRAIGTEGSYQVFDVSVDSKAPPGTVLIQMNYAPDGHALLSKMLIGLHDETVKQLGQMLPGTLRLSGIEGQTFYSPEPGGKAILLDCWEDHVVSDRDSDKVTAEWHFQFSTATLSPEGYSAWFGYSPPSKGSRQVSGHVGIHYAGEHPLGQTVEKLAASLQQFSTVFAQSSKSVIRALFVIALALIYLAWIRS